MVAAAKLRRAQENAESARPYSERMETVLGNLARSNAGSDSAPRLLKGSGGDQTHMLIVATSERGLCGGFNSSIVKLARARAAELLAEGKTVKILTVGKKGREQLGRDYAAYLTDHVDLSDVKSVGYVNAKSVSDTVISGFNAGEFDVATIFYNTFESVISQVPTARQLIPAQFAVAEEDDADSTLSEQGARMSAMDNATRNAGEMIDKLTIQFNRSRQAAITNELIEIISGAEAL